MQVEAYQGELEQAIQGSINASSVAYLSMDDMPEGVPAFKIMVLRPELGPRLIHTSGVGHVAQPYSDSRDDNVLVELMTYVNEGGVDQSIAVLRMLGALLHMNGPDEAWKAFDTVRLADAVAGQMHFVLRPGGHVSIGDRVVTLLSVVPLAAAEYVEVTSGRASIWLEQRMADPDARSAFIARWGQRNRE